MCDVLRVMCDVYVLGHLHGVCVFCVFYFGWFMVWVGLGVLWVFFIFVGWVHLFIVGALVFSLSLSLQWH